MTLAEYLEQNGDLTQSDLAQAARVSPVLVSMYVNGKRRPGIAIALAIERATGGAVPHTVWVSDEESERYGLTD